MSNKKGGLGKPNALNEDKEDLLGSVFGESASSKGIDTAPPTTHAKSVEQKVGDSAKNDRVGKYFQLDKQLVKQVKIFAIEHDMKEVAVIEEALRFYLKSRA